MSRSFPFKVLLIIFALAAVTPAFGEANWVSLNGSIAPEKPSAEVISSNGSETIITFRLTGFTAENMTEDGVVYQALKFPGYATTLDIGKPGLPVISELIGIPGNADVRVSVVDYSEVTLSNYRVYPFQTPLRQQEERTGFDIDREAYRKNAFYPDLSASVGEPSIWRDLRVVNLRVNPLKYNPATGELRACSEITVKLDFTGTNNKNAKAPSMRSVSTDYDRMYRQRVLNYPDLNLTVDDATDGAYDYLVIAADAYVSNMTPFINWKNSQGVATNIAAISTVGSDFETIKAYIETEYFTNGIRYVLLVGNEDDIPAYTMQGIFSDYDYTLLEGDDYLAEIAIGRFCVANAAHVDNMVSKSVTFESDPPAGEWLEKSLLVANWEEAPLKYQECKEQVRTAAETPSGTYTVLYPDFTTAYGASYANGGDEASNNDVIAYINSGQRLVNYRGHGSYTQWQYWNVYGQYFTNSDVALINNGQMTPVVFSIACLNNDLRYNGVTIGEAFTQGDDAAVAYLGASDPSYTIPNHDYDKQLYEAIFDAGINAIGYASNLASVVVIDLWGSYGITNARMYLWLGDPSLQLIYTGGQTCCEIRGDVDHNGQMDVLDLDYFLDYLYRGGSAPPCEEEADADGSGQVDVLDLDYLIDHLYREGPAPVPCP